MVGLAVFGVGVALSMCCSKGRRGFWNAAAVAAGVSIGLALIIGTTAPGRQHIEDVRLLFLCLLISFVVFPFHPFRIRGCARVVDVGFTLTLPPFPLPFLHPTLPM